MGLFFIYSLKVALCLIAFYLVYKLLLSRETFFGFNRAVLLGMAAVSLLLPLVRFTVDSAPSAVGGFVIVEDIVMQAVAADAPAFSVTAAQVCFAIYIIGVAFFAGREAWSLICLRRMIRRGRVVSRDGGVKTVVVKDDVSPFSWMGNIVISEKDYADSPEYILVHERAHVAARHSVDILLCDLLIVFQWFNPTAWLLKAELQCVHEYEADSRVLASGVNASDYQLLLIRKAVGDKLFSMANNLNQSSLKKRITMMLKKKSNPWSRARMLVAVPVAAVAVVAFATPKAESLSNEIKSESEALVSKVMPVVQAQAPPPSRGVELTVTDYSRLEDITWEIASALEGKTDRYGQEFCARNIEQLNPGIFAWLGILDVNIWVILVLMIGVAGFTMISGLLIIIIERTSMIGVLKSLGADNRTIRHLFLWFSVFLIGKGMLWGNVIGLAFYVVQRFFGLFKLDPATYYMDTVPVSFNLWIFLPLNAGTLLASILMLVGPSYLITRIRPADSMRYE